MTIGLVFIWKVLQGAIDSLDKKQEEKYRHSPEYASFRQNHGLLGRKWGSSKSAVSVIDDTTVNNEAITDKVDKEHAEKET